MSRSACRAALLMSAAPFALGACTVGTVSPTYTTREQKVFTVSGTPHLVLATFDGPVEIRSWDRADVQVEVVKSGATRELVDAILVTATQENDRIRIEARRPETREWAFNLLCNSARQARLIASVPRRCNVVAVTGDGPISAEQLEGRAEFHTGDGTVHASHVQGEIVVETGDGSIRLENAKGRVDLMTGDGAIFAEGLLSAVRARTGDGTISVRAQRGSVMGADWDLSTGDGGVVVYLPERFGAELDAETHDGVVRCDAALGVAGGEPALEGGESTKQRVLRGRVGGGGPVIRIRTGDGPISVRQM